MPSSILEIKERLEQIIDGNGTVRDMSTAAEAISILEQTSVTKEDLESTRVGLYVNNIRKALRNGPLAKRAKNLIKTWQQLIDGGTPQPRPQRTRPETPNSVGSSPSPPEPSDYNPIRNYSIPQRSPRPDTPTSGGKKSRKYKSNPGITSRKNDVPDAVSKKGQSSVAGQNMHISFDTGQPTVSMKSNGLKLTIKAPPSLQESANQSTSTVSDSNKPVPSTKTNSKASIPHKFHKKKKGHKNLHKTPSPAMPSSTAERALQKTEDTRNNNIKSSKSTPNLTVNNTSPLNNTKIVTPKSYNNLKNLASNAEKHNLKRKREQSAVDGVSQERSSDKPRAAKERRLTFDPVTRQLKQVPSDKPDTQSSVSLSEKKTEKVLNTTRASKSEINPGSRARNVPRTLEKKPLPDAPKEETKNVISEDAEIEISNKLSELPTGLSPSVKVCGGNTISKNVSCFPACSKSSNFYEARREFQKRKTRRKHPTSFDATTLYPFSNLVQTLASDSDENSDSESGFCGGIKVQEFSELDGRPTHSLGCKQPGVTGCRGNNGSWYDWMETFCIKNHENSKLLPEEEEILPLQILPYVELD